MEVVICAECDADIALTSGSVEVLGIDDTRTTERGVCAECGTIVTIVTDTRWKKKAATAAGGE